MYTQTKTISSKRSPGAIILTAVIAAGLITLQHVAVSIHDNDMNRSAYAQEDTQGSIVFFDSGYSTKGLLDGQSVASGSTSGRIDSLRDKVAQMRDGIISLIPDEIALSQISDGTSSSTGISLGSGLQVQNTMPVIADIDISCERSFPEDIANHPQLNTINWALDHCLIQANSDNKISADIPLTHEMMLVIADRAGFDVDLARGSSAIVTRDDLKRFLDYLLASKQIDGVPARQYNDRLTRVEYLTLMHAIIPSTMVLATATVTSSTINNAPISLIDTSPSSSTITVAQFKQQLNTQLGTTLTIMSYDATVTATAEIQQSIILDLLKANNTSMHGAPTTAVSLPQDNSQTVGIGLNKEMLKSLLGSLVQNI